MLKKYLEDLKTYDEGLYLMSEFTIGFELEAWGKTMDDKNKFDDWARNFFADDEFVDKSVSNIGYDSSIHPDDGLCSNDNICPECGGSGSWECNNCYGSGVEENECQMCEGSGEITCPECNGEGVIRTADDEEVKCKACGGTGAQECNRCGGSGTIEATCSVCNGRGEVYCDYCGGDGYIDDDDNDNRTFEWRSPIFKLVPKNLSAIVKFLSEAVRDRGINTNKSCGFHIHIGFPDKKNVATDMFWVLCQMNVLNQGKKIKELQEFKGFEMVDRSYSSPQFISEIGESLEEIQREINNYDDKDKNFKNVMADIFTNEMKKRYRDIKYTLLRVHPKGTLEWRGPRRFLDDKNRKIISKFFFKKLHPFVKWVNDVLELKTLKIGKYELDKNTFRKAIEEKIKSGTYPSWIEIPKTQEEQEREQRRLRRFSRNQNVSELHRIFRLAPWLGRRGTTFANATITIDSNTNKIMFYGGWNSGDFVDGHFRGDFNSGRFLNGTMNADVAHGAKFVNGNFVAGNFRGIFEGGDFLNGYFQDGRFKGGIFHNGSFYDGRFEGGTFNGGKWINGEWIDGEWKGGYIDINKGEGWHNQRFVWSNINPKDFFVYRERQRGAMHLGFDPLDSSMVGKIPSRNEHESMMDYFDRIEKLFARHGE